MRIMVRSNQFKSKVPQYSSQFGQDGKELVIDDCKFLYGANEMDNPFQHVGEKENAFFSCTFSLHVVHAAYNVSENALNLS